MVFSSVVRYIYVSLATFVPTGIIVLGVPFITTLPLLLVACFLNIPTSLQILSKYSSSAVSAKEFKKI